VPRILPPTAPRGHTAFCPTTIEPLTCPAQDLLLDQSHDALHVGDGGLRNAPDQHIDSCARTVRRGLGHPRPGLRGRAPIPASAHAGLPG